MRIHWRVALATVLALSAAACDSEQEAPPEDVENDDVEAGDAETGEGADGGPAAQLDDAVAATVAEGTAVFHSESQTFAVGPAADEDGQSDGEQSEDETDPDDEDRPELGEDIVEVQGEVDFGSAGRVLELSGEQDQSAGADLTAILDGDDRLFVDRWHPAEDGDDEEAQWGRADVDGLVDAGPGSAIVLLHDPWPILELMSEDVGDVRDGARTDGGEARTGEDARDDRQASESVIPAESPDLVATVEAGESPRPQLAVLSDTDAQRTVEVSVWLSSDGTIEEVLYGLDASIDEEATRDEPYPGLVYVHVSLGDLGGSVDVDVPDQDSVVDVDPEQLDVLSDRYGLDGTDDADDGAD